jgi:preprotein translocase subunit Sec61beta
MQAHLRRYAAAWGYLAIFTIGDITLALLSPGSRSAVQQWASTNIANLHHDPLGSLVVSALIPGEEFVAWPFLIAIALFGANRVLGNWRTVLVCVAGHLLGTLVSEGIAAYRIGQGLLPESAAHIIDIGPSYVVVAAITVAILYGPWLVRILAAVDLLLLIFGGGIFDGLTSFEVAAVGHTTSLLVAAGLGSVLVWQLRRTRATPPARATASDVHGS